MTAPSGERAGHVGQVGAGRRASRDPEAELGGAVAQTRKKRPGPGSGSGVRSRRLFLQRREVHEVHTGGRLPHRSDLAPAPSQCHVTLFPPLLPPFLVLPLLLELVRGPERLPVDQRVRHALRARLQLLQAAAHELEALLAVSARPSGSGRQAALSAHACARRSCPPAWSLSVARTSPCWSPSAAPRSSASSPPTRRQVVALTFDLRDGQRSAGPSSSSSRVAGSLPGGAAAGARPVAGGGGGGRGGQSSRGDPGAAPRGPPGAGRWA